MTYILIAVLIVALAYVVSGLIAWINDYSSGDDDDDDDGDMVRV